MSQPYRELLLADRRGEGLADLPGPNFNQKGMTMNDTTKAVVATLAPVIKDAIAAGVRRGGLADAKAADLVTREVAAVVVNQTNQEPWYQSRVTWGAIIAVAGGLTGLAGYTLDAEDQAALASVPSLLGDHDRAIPMTACWPKGWRDFFVLGTAMAPNAFFRSIRLSLPPLICPDQGGLFLRQQRNSSRSEDYPLLP